MERKQLECLLYTAYILGNYLKSGLCVRNEISSLRFKVLVSGIISVSPQSYTSATFAEI